MELMGNRSNWEDNLHCSRLNLAKATSFISNESNLAVSKVVRLLYSVWWRSCPGRLITNGHDHRGESISLTDFRDAGSRFCACIITANKIVLELYNCQAATTEAGTHTRARGSTQLSISKGNVVCIIILNDVHPMETTYRCLFSWNAAGARTDQRRC